MEILWEDLPLSSDGVEQAQETTGHRGGYLLAHLLRFGQLLRVMGLDVSTRQTLDLIEALEHVPITNRQDFYYTGRALLVNRREDFVVYDQAFQLFWQAESPEAQESPAPDKKLKRLRLPSEPMDEEMAMQDVTGAGEGRRIPGDEGEGESSRERQMIYSPKEVLRRKDFGEMTWEEIQEAKQAIAALRWRLGERRTCRTRSGPKGRLDLRRMVRDNLRHGGEPVILSHRKRVYRPRALVVLCDISGSMDRYTRMLLHFVHALTHGLTDTEVETFVFGTRLTRITRYLRYRDVDESLDELGEAVRDWSGGTRIGEALKTFNFQWARRVLGRGAVVLIISDGWDRGDMSLLQREIARLQRAAYRLIWLNPLLGANNYQPIQQGMAVVRPYLDDFLPIHNLASLEQLAELLNSVAELRPVRKQQVRMSMSGPLDRREALRLDRLVADEYPFLQPWMGLG